MDLELIGSLVLLLIGIACYFSVRRMRTWLQRFLRELAVIVESSSVSRSDQTGDSTAFASIGSRLGVPTLFTEVDESLKWFLVAGAVLVLWGMVAVLDAAGVLAAVGLPFDLR